MKHKVAARTRQPGLQGALRELVADLKIGQYTGEER